MSSHDWRWRIGEAVERIRSRYDYIGRKTGAPFLALVYPPEVEVAVLKEWQTQTAALRPEFDVRTVDALAVTQQVLSEIGADNIVAALKDPMPGSDPQMELGRLWLKAITETVRATLSAAGSGCEEIGTGTFATTDSPRFSRFSGGASPISSQPRTGRPVASLQRLAAVYPALGPRDVMQNLWDNNQSTLDGPVVVLIPGYVTGPRTFSFVGKHDEFMYRGDLL